MALPSGFQPTDEYSRANLGMSLADYYAKNPGAQQQVQQNQTTQNNSDPFKVAQQARDFNIQSNQPAIQTLQQNKTDLGGQYQTLLDSIKGQQGVAQDAQTRATNSNLAARGITSDTGIGAQQLSDSLRPIAQQYQSLTANTGLQRQQDMNGIASQIASLQAGNPEQALSFGQGFSAQQQQAQALAQQIAIQQQQANQEGQYQTGELSNQKAQLDQALQMLQKVTLPQSQASITAALAGAGASGASANLNNYMLGQYQNGGLSVSNNANPLNLQLNNR